MIVCRLTLVNFVVVLLLVSGCKPAPDQPPTSAQKSVLERIEERVLQCETLQPDSVEILLLKGLQISDSLGLEESRLKMHSMLSEFYQYRKISDGKAYHHMNEAISIYLKNPDYSINNPYFFTNLGNIQFKFGLLAEAQESYNNALSSAYNAGISHGIVLAYNNKGLVWLSLGNADSAYRCFIKASDHASETDLSKAQNLLYQMRLAAFNGQKSMLSALHIKIKKSINDFIEMRGGNSGFDGAEQRYFNQVLGEAEGILADVSQDAGRTALLQSSVRKSVLSCYPLLMADRYIALGSYYAEIGDIGKASSISDSLNEVARMILNPEPLSRIYGFRKQTALLAGNTRKAETAAKLESFMLDSLKRQQSGKEQLQAKMAISAANARIAVENMKQAAQVGQRIIRQQKIIIAILLSSIVLILLMITLVFVFRKRLNFANRLLALKTSSQTLSEITDPAYGVPKYNLDRPGFEGLAERLEKLNQEKQPYLNPALSLSDLASLAGTNQTYLSAFLNQHMKLNFNDYLNNLRILYACRLLLSSDNEYSTEQILEMSGFNSKSTFYTAFKKHAGVSPAVFCKMNRETPVQESGL